MKKKSLGMQYLQLLGGTTGALEIKDAGVKWF